MLGSTVGWSRIKDSLYSVPLFASLVAAATDWGLDVLKAVLISSPAVILAAAYLVESALNQAFRKMGVGKKIETPEERALWITATAATQISEAKSWRQSRSLTRLFVCSFVRFFFFFSRFFFARVFSRLIHRGIHQGLGSVGSHTA